MGATLPLVLNWELLERVEKGQIKCIGTDLDGFLTNLHYRSLTQLIFDNVVSHLPKKLRRGLEGKKLGDIADQVGMRTGWFLDTETGYMVFPKYFEETKGEIVDARKGNIQTTKKRKKRIIEEYEPINPVNLEEFS